ncbi:hypothetical protein ABD91_21365 [Lysinibacillus sphaericus]|nr:hypothetical protein [Lysinibacillus sphaericus]
MTKEKFDRSETHANIGKIGHVGHGQTSLTAAIAEVLNRCSKCCGLGTIKDSDKTCTKCNGTGKRVPA